MPSIVFDPPFVCITFVQTMAATFFLQPICIQDKARIVFASIINRMWLWLRFLTFKLNRMRFTS